MRKTPRTPSRTTTASNQHSLSKAKSLAAAACCGLILLTGFFFAGHQHFSSMDYGIRNSRLRKQLDDLQAEKQRLLYTKEVALSPNEIKKAAKRSGLFDGRDAKAAITPELASARPKKQQPTVGAIDTKPAVIKTVSSAPVAPKAVKAMAVVAQNEAPQKRASAK